MKQSAKSLETVRITKEQLLGLVSAKLKDRVLFPKKLEEAKQYASKLKDVKFN